MRLNILIGGKAGQGINKISEIVSDILVKRGYYVFNYRDYQSLIRGGHSFNVLSISESKVGSYETKLDIIVALDEKTIELHKKELKREGIIVDYKNFNDCGKDLNVALASALMKIFGIEENVFFAYIKNEFGDLSVEIAKKCSEKEKEKYKLKDLGNKNIKIISGSDAIAKGAINSKLDLYLAYPMTPATGVLHSLANKEKENNLMVYQPENEIAIANAALGSSFAGAKTMIGTSGGGFDLMTEALSMQGMAEIPLTVYLASRPGPGTGIPTYTSQPDLNVALKGAHGEFSRIVVAPGDPIECIEKTNEALYLAEKFKTLSIILSDKHLAESYFSSDREPNKTLTIKVNRKVPGEAIVKASSYEHDKLGNTSEDHLIAEEGFLRRQKTYEEIKKECKKFEMIKIYGKVNSKNLIIGWGSTKTVILDAIEGLDYKFMQILYLKPMSEEIKEEIKKAKKIILVENNCTGQLGRLIREKTGFKIENRILKCKGLPFASDELKEKILRIK
jgi:2-oxoglutarate/2-oxoacid ferredoxin oxidoreductase subunit alpha